MNSPKPIIIRGNFGRTEELIAATLELESALATTEDTERIRKAREAHETATKELAKSRN